MIGFVIIGSSGSYSDHISDPIKVVLGSKEKAEQELAKVVQRDKEVSELINEFSALMECWKQTAPEPEQYYYSGCKGRRVGSPGQLDETKEEFRKRRAEHERNQDAMRDSYNRRLSVWIAQRDVKAKELFHQLSERAEKFGITLEHGRLMLPNSKYGYEDYEIFEIEVVE